MPNDKVAVTLRIVQAGKDITVDLTSFEYEQILADQDIEGLGPLSKLVEAVLLQSFTLGTTTYDTWYYIDSRAIKIERSFDDEE